MFGNKQKNKWQNYFNCDDEATQNALIVKINISY